MTIKAKKSKINLREKLAELLNFRQIRDRMDGLGLYLGKDRTGTAENVAIRGGADVDDLQLAEISATLGGTAVDVFVYDTRNDSDGGKWRERTSHTSWYNEELNTATRGSRREFPAVAVIVAETKKVTIYDGDDPDMGMWMVFNVVSSMNLITNSTVSSVTALNGIVGVACNGPNPHFTPIDFISEKSGHYTIAGNKYFLFDISKRNNTSSPAHGSYDGTVAIVNGIVNDLAMTVLPNAPIDEDTGLPVPTIAVATDGGVSVIKDDGSVVDLYRATGDEDCSTITFDSNNSLFVSWGVNNSSYRHVSYWASIPNSNDTELTDNYYTVIKNRGGSFAGDGGTGNVKISNHARAFAVTDNFEKLTLLDHNDLDTSKSQFCDITSTYNTGWMPGDIKLATLSDTKVEKVGVDESISASLISNGENWTGASGSTPPTDWSQYGSGANDAIYSISGGELTITENGSGNYGIMYQAFDVVAGQTYTVTVRYKSSGTGFARFFIGTGPGSALVLSTQNTGSTDFITKSITFSDTNSRTLYLSFAAVGEEGASAIFDYVSITKTGELITNGTFDNGIEGWEQNATAWSVVNGEAANSTLAGGLDQEISCIAGNKYVVSFDITQNFADGQSGVYVRYGNGSPYVDKRVQDGSTGSFNITFVATEATHIIRLYRGANSGTIAFDNISVRLAEDDRSVNDNGLQIFGEITKTPVATGADLVAYSGFSADNYLMQPYNPDLDFGTGDFCVMGWFKQSPTTNYHTYFDRGGRIVVYVNLSTSALNFRISDGTNHMNCLSVSAVDNDTWTFFVGVKSNGATYNYINGKLERTANYATVGSLDGDFDSYFGVSVDGVRHGDKMALWRVSATIPTDDQIDKIYRDEKALFTDGAQATLYGTDDAVTALAYDDKTELLHVGTSDGRSDFAGLRRINNTTTAVTTSISASNNLIAEQ